MVSSCPTHVLVLALATFALLAVCEGDGAVTLKHHGGPILGGQMNIAILWYGSFAHVQKNTVGTFIKSLNHNLGANTHPQVSEWWRAVEGYTTGAPHIGVGVVKQMTEAEYPSGKVLTYDFVAPLVQKVAAGSPNTVAVIVADRQVSVHGLCSGKCYLRGVVAEGNIPYIVIGNPETECPDSCAWPFQPSAAGGLTLKPPSGNVGADSMVMNLASGLAAVVTNPFNNGWFDGPSVEPIEAATACPNVFGSGALPGQPGKVLTDPASGATFNAIGSNDKKFLLPAIWTPVTSNCWALL